MKIAEHACNEAAHNVLHPMTSLKLILDLSMLEDHINISSFGQGCTLYISLCSTQTRQTFRQANQGNRDNRESTMSSYSCDSCMPSC